MSLRASYDRLGSLNATWVTKQDRLSFMKKHAEIAADVIETEIAGLTALVALLRDGDSGFSAAVAEAINLLAGLEGRLILTGMGKSGHVARKIAATFASTGTAASFVHPGEASHGDLGMITRDDIVVALSNSGETAELGDIVAYVQRFSIPLIVMTGRSASTLARAATISLVLPDAEEACATTPAPTTTTTMMMALGDALAVALLQEKGVTAGDFRSFHPGGRLGAALKRVTDLMHHTQIPLCKGEDSVEHAVDIITTSGFGCAGVVDAKGVLIGMVTDGDLRRHFRSSLSEARVADIMTRDPHVVLEDSVAAEALALFSDRKITAVFIVNAARHPLGLLHVHDCLEIGVI